MFKKDKKEKKDKDKDKDKGREDKGGDAGGSGGDDYHKLQAEFDAYRAQKENELRNLEAELEDRESANRPSVIVL